MNNLEKHKADHLLLLLGKNPLPNAVAGELLIKPVGSITMLYTADTARAVKNLESFLIRAKFNPSVQIDEADAHSIFKGVFKALDEGKSHSIGLHYTGGTKAMSVHAYRAVERWRNGKSCQTVFSYLDARSLEMVFDPVDPESGSGERIYVGNQIEISLEQLIGLHGWSFNKKPGKPILPVRQALLPKLASALALVHLTSDSIEAWKTWKSAHIKSGWTWPLPDALLLVDVREAMEEGLCCSSGQIQPENSAKKLGIEGQDLRKWLDSGLWLEHHVLQCLTELSESLELKDCCQANKIAVPGGTDFDLDVVALHSYQLFAFSCGIGSNLDDKKYLKPKLFEVYVRARQLGGDEARIALVSNYPDPDGLQSEIRKEYDSEERIKVFGQPHLSDLKSAIAPWIKEQSHIQ